MSTRHITHDQGWPVMVTPAVMAVGSSEEDRQAREYDLCLCLHVQENEFRAKLQAQHEQFRAHFEAQRQRIKDLEAALAEDQKTAPEKVQLEAETDEKERDGRRALEAAFHATGDTIFGDALNSLNRPDASCAAHAYTLVSSITAYCGPVTLDLIKSAERAVRDILVLRCSSRFRPGDRNGFLMAAGEAFGMDLLTKPKRPESEQKLRSALLLAFHKVYQRKPNTDMSNSQLRLGRGARPRPKRKRGVATTRSRSLPASKLWNPFCDSE